MKIWAVNTLNIFSGMTHTSLFINKEDAEAKYNAFKNRGATIGQADDIWNFCAQHFDDVIIDVVDSFYEEDSHWSSVKKTEDDESIDIYKALTDVCYEVFGSSDRFNVNVHWNNYHSSLVFISVSWNYEGKNRLWTDVYLEG